MIGVRSQNSVNLYGSVRRAGATMSMLCMLLSAQIQASGISFIEVQSDVSVVDYLESQSGSSTFVTALKQSSVWETIINTDGLSLFVADNESLRIDGSAFLLDVVLVKAENKQRLDQLMALHYYSDALLIDKQLNTPQVISAQNGSCFNVEPADGELRVGPESVIKKVIRAANGSIFFIDHLLWTPYKDTDTCN